MKNLLLVTVALSVASTSLATSTRLVRMPSGKIESLEVELVDGREIIDGDILLPQKKMPSASVIVDAAGSRWRQGVIPFVIASDMPNESRENIYRAMLEISFYTSVRFVERKSQMMDYVLFTPSDKGICASPVGREGGMQEIVLSPRCKKGSTIHEMMHALGFWHEQSRADRDNHIEIRWENIPEDKKHNFIRHDEDGIDKGEYDYDSIMHYGAKSFSKNGEDTIVPLIPGKKIGQRDKMSANDIKTLRELYS